MLIFSETFLLKTLNIKSLEFENQLLQLGNKLGMRKNSIYIWKSNKFASKILSRMFYTCVV